MLQLQIIISVFLVLRILSKNCLMDFIIPDARVLTVRLKPLPGVTSL